MSALIDFLTHLSWLIYRRNRRGGWYRKKARTKTAKIKASRLGR